MIGGLWCDACDADLERMRVQINDLLGIWGGKLQAICPVCNYIFPVAISPTGRVVCVDFKGLLKQRPDWFSNLGEEGEGPRYAVDDKRRTRGGNAEERLESQASGCQHEWEWADNKLFKVCLNCQLREDGPNLEADTVWCICAKPDAKKMEDTLGVYFCLKCRKPIKQSPFESAIEEEK